MKKIIVSLAIIIMAGAAVNAQQPDRSMQQNHPHQFHHHGYRHGNDMMAKKLNFSDQQKEQLKNINNDYHKKLMDLKKNFYNEQMFGQ